MSYEARHFLHLASQASNLRALRLDKRLTQEQVAAKLNVSRSYYSGIERGVRRCFDQRQSLGVRGFTLLRHPGESRGPVLFARWIQLAPE